MNFGPRTSRQDTGASLAASRRVQPGSWVRAPYGAKLHLVAGSHRRYLVTECGRYFPPSLAPRLGAHLESRCCKTCVKAGVRP